MALAAGLCRVELPLVLAKGDVAGGGIRVVVGNERLHEGAVWAVRRCISCMCGRAQLAMLAVGPGPHVTYSWSRAQVVLCCRCLLLGQCADTGASQRPHESPARPVQWRARVGAAV